MRTSVMSPVVMALCAFGFMSAASVSAQTRQPASGVIGPAAQQTAAGGTQVRRLTADEAVRLAAENNLGIQIARFDPQIEDLNVLQTRDRVDADVHLIAVSRTATPRRPTASSRARRARSTPTSSPEHGGAAAAAVAAAATAVGFDGARSTSNNFFSNFNPQLRSSLSLNFTQPLLRGFEHRQHPRSSCKSGRRTARSPTSGSAQTLATTRARCATRTGIWRSRSPRCRCSGSRSSWPQESLRNTRARVEIGTTPPIDIVEAEAEVAHATGGGHRRRGADRNGRGHVARARLQPVDAGLLDDPIEPVDLPPFEPSPVDVDAAIRTALDRRTDLLQTRKSMEVDDINIRFLQNQTLPDVTAQFDYGLSAHRRHQFIRVRRRRPDARRHHRRGAPRRRIGAGLSADQRLPGVDARR